MAANVSTKNRDIIRRTGDIRVRERRGAPYVKRRSIIAIATAASVMAN
jgi:hypothetical protein